MNARSTRKGSPEKLGDHLDKFSFELSLTGREMFLLLVILGNISGHGDVYNKLLDMYKTILRCDGMNGFQPGVTVGGFGILKSKAAIEVTNYNVFDKPIVFLKKE